MDLYDKLVDYSQSDVYPFHMPGHKRQVGNPFLQEFPNPYAIDITEIDGFDNLHHAEGIIRESMDRAAKMYGADRSYYLVNGSSCGILMRGLRDDPAWREEFYEPELAIRRLIMGFSSIGCAWNIFIHKS